jgi:transcriptional regulator with XRE-family HTH domain
MPKDGVQPTDKHVGVRVRTRRLMLDMSQTDLGDALGLTFQQVQKYEKGANRVAAGRLQHISQILQVPVEFFFEGAPHARGQRYPQTRATSPQYVSDYLATKDGLQLTKLSKSPAPRINDTRRQKRPWKITRNGPLRACPMPCGTKPIRRLNQTLASHPTRPKSVTWIPQRQPIWYRRRGILSVYEGA